MYVILLADQKLAILTSRHTRTCGPASLATHARSRRRRGRHDGHGSYESEMAAWQGLAEGVSYRSSLTKYAAAR